MRKSVRSVILQIIVVAVLAGGGYGLWSHRDGLPLIGNAATPDGGGKPQRPPTPVDVAVARAGTITLTLEAMGTAQANEAVILSSEVTGVIARIRFEEGQDVEKGAVLVNLDSSVQRAEVEVRLADVEVRQAQLENAQQLYDRAVRLRESRNVAAARVDELAAALKAARAAVRSAEAAVKAARARVVKRRIVAPFDGRLGMRHVSPGALIEPGGPIVSLDDISVIKLDFQVPEKNLSNLRVGQEITAQSEAYPTRVFFGTVTSIDTRVDPVTRAVAARARIDNTDLALKPGMFLLVELGVSERHNAVLIPEEAVVSDGTARFVYVVVDGQAKRRSVALGQRLPREVEVLEGVKAGEAVIVGGVQKVRDGTPVAARERTAPTS